ncbi:MAG: hypothetical protein GY869_27245 [Planctomycetes bacterium]|nr:hypothetical protein [Planctomycetota bacterium]
MGYLNDLAEESNAEKVRDWLLSEEGQEVVKESGYVPILEFDDSVLDDN